MKNNYVLLRVNDDAVARSRMAMKVAQADYGWDSESARDYGCVRSPAARIRGDCARVFEIKLCCGRRQQIFRDDNCIFGKFFITMTLAAQGNDKPLRHVFDVRAASAQVIVLDLCVDCEQPVRRDLHSPFGIDAVFAYVPSNVLKKFTVFEHQQVRVEDVSVLCAQLFFSASLDCQELHSGKPHGCAKTAHLTLHILLIQSCAIDLTRAVEDAQHAPYNNTFGDAKSSPSCLLSLDSSTPCQRAHPLRTLLRTDRTRR